MLAGRDDAASKQWVFTAIAWLEKLSADKASD
jgi:hypothetical protein